MRNVLVGALALVSCKEVTFDIFSQERILEVEIQMNPGDFQTLRGQTRDILDILRGDCLSEPFDKVFTYFPGHVTIQGIRIENVGVRKKGFIGSLSEEKPGIKIDFGEFDTEQRAFGLKKLTLNNSIADPSFIRQCLTYDFFREAGIPSPECGFAHVTVNGEDMGIYVNVESPNKRYLSRHYRDNDGNLYEGTLSDFRDGWTGTFEPKTNEEENDKSDLLTVVEALNVDDAALISSLEAVIDLDQFMTFWAMETLVNHADGYTGNTNNFYVYNDPRTDRLQFLPWGVDFTFAPGNFLGPGVPVSVMAMGALSRRLYLHPEGRERYLLELNRLLDTVWNEDSLLARVDKMEALLSPVVNSSSFALAIGETRAFIEGRRFDIESELVSGAPEWTLPLRDDLCLRDVGTMSGEFSTVFTSNDPDPFANSTGLLEVALQGQPLVLSQFSSSATPDTDRPGNIAIQDIAVTEDNRLAVGFVTVPAALAESGEPVVMDLGASIGAFFFFDPITQQSELIGLFLGEITFDPGSFTVGQPVSGSFSGELVTAPF
jgi:spore coat protein H